MQNQVVVTGIVIKQSPVGESDRLVTILTNSRGKIHVFARGARKPNSRFAAASGPFAFGTFHLYEGKDSYNLADAEIQNYFEELMSNFEGACYGAYLAEIVDYYCVENGDEREMMKLFYQSLRALSSDVIPNPLVRSVFELKSIMINGEYPGIPTDLSLSDGARYALEYIAYASVQKLYSFTLTDAALKEVAYVADLYRKRIMAHSFKSLEILDTLC